MAVGNLGDAVEFSPCSEAFRAHPDPRGPWLGDISLLLLWLQAVLL